MAVSLISGDITRLDSSFDAVVNPANSYGTMGGGVALAIRNSGGQVIEDEAVALAPILVGSAVVTSAGSLAFSHVIHAPTMKEPVERIGIENVRRAVAGALDCAKKNGFKKIAFPGMGTGVGMVDKMVAARVMVDEIGRFIDENHDPFEVVLVAFDDELYASFGMCLSLLHHFN